MATSGTVEHITPSREELLPFHKIYCKEVNCAAIFTNVGNYELHMQRHHKIKPQVKVKLKSSLRHYYCPELDCVYNINAKPSGRCFKHVKNLRQHFQKVHYKKTICENCGRAFPTEPQFRKHVETECGKHYNCLTCFWDFETKDALVLHGKRKGHVVEEKEPTIKLNTTKRKLSNSKPPDSVAEKKVLCTQQNAEHYNSEAQTENPIGNTIVQANSILDKMHTVCQDTETQTDTNGRIMMGSSDISESHDIETQTEPTSHQCYEQHTSPINNSRSGGGFLDQMLSQTPLAHMHTQTCDDYLLSELGLTDIQTQTNWTSFSDGAGITEHAKHMYTTASTSTSTTGFAYDELLVSTETQTSFTQCLLDSTDNGSAACDTGEESNAINYVHLYNTQYTQTCDLLLEGLFGGQENDLITGFQSTYTQT